MRIGTLEDLFINDTVKAVYDYWISLPREPNQLFPKRFEVDLEALPEAVLDYIFIMAHLGESVFSIAESGKAINAFLGERLQGQNIIATRSELQLPIEKRYYDTIFGSQCGGMVVRKSLNIAGNAAHLNSIHFPLLDYRDEVRYMLGVIAVTGREAPEEADVPLIQPASEVLEQIIVDLGAGPTSLPKE